MSDAIVVGGTRGIGREIAAELVNRGHSVTIVGRGGGAGADVAAELGAAFAPADVSDLDDVRRLGAELAATAGELAWLVQTADVIRKKRVVTPQGFEVSFATNYLSRFLLVTLLRDRLISGAATVLHVAAAGAPGRLDVSALPPGPEIGGIRAHNMSQGANDVFGVELAERLRGTGVRVHVANPGLVDTGIRDDLNASRTGRVMTFGFSRLMKVRPADEVATALLAAVEAHPERVLVRLGDKTVRTPRRARNADGRRAVWERTEELTGVRWVGPAV